MKPLEVSIELPVIWAPVGGYPGVHAGEETGAFARIGKVHLLDC
jgi:hypothetical protein